MAGPVAGVGLFPSGRPERAYERVVIWTVALAGFLLPLLEAVSEANIAPAGGPPDSVPPVLYRTLYVPALTPLGGAAEAVASEWLSPLALATTVGSMLVAWFYTGAFGIDEPARRTFVHRVPRVSITVALALLAILVGVLTSLAAPAAVADRAAAVM